MRCITLGYAEAMLAATPQSQLVDPERPKTVGGLTTAQMSLMERESSNLEREFKLAEKSYGTDQLDLLVAKGYLVKLLGNARVSRYLAMYYGELLLEFRRILGPQPSSTQQDAAAIHC
jgi:hypothetical protein